MLILFIGFPKGIHGSSGLDFLQILRCKLNSRENHLNHLTESFEKIMTNLKRSLFQKILQMEASYYRATCKVSISFISQYYNFHFNPNKMYTVTLQHLLVQCQQ